MSTTKTVFAIGGSIVAFLLFACVIGWLAKGNDFFMFKFFAPREEAVRREVFENSKSYIHGTIQELRNMQMEYVKADDNHKQALGSIILHRVNDFGESNLPMDLKTFVNQIKKDKGITY